MVTSGLTTRRSSYEAMLLTVRRENVENVDFTFVVILPRAATFLVVNLSVTRDYELQAPVCFDFMETSLIFATMLVFHVRLFSPLH